MIFKNYLLFQKYKKQKFHTVDLNISISRRMVSVALFCVWLIPTTRVVTRAEIKTTVQYFVSVGNSWEDILIRFKSWEWFFLTNGSQSTIFTSTCTLKISVFDIEENFGNMIIGRTENDLQDSNCLIWITVNIHFALYSECFWQNAASVKSSTTLNAMDTCICLKVVTFRNTPI